MLVTQENCIGGLVPVLAVSFLIQLPANVAGKTADGGLPTNLGLCHQMGNHDGVPGS